MLPAPANVNAWAPVIPPVRFNVAPASAPIVAAVARVIAPLCVTAAPANACNAPPVLMPEPFSVSGSAEFTPAPNCNAAPAVPATVVAAAVPKAAPSVTRTTPAFTNSVPDHPELFPLNVTIPLSAFVTFAVPDNAPATVSPGVPADPGIPATDHVWFPDNAIDRFASPTVAKFDTPFTTIPVAPNVNVCADAAVSEYPALKINPAAVTGPPIVITFPEPVPPNEATSAAKNAEFADPVHQFVADVVQVPSPCCTPTVPVSKSQTSVAPRTSPPQTTKNAKKRARKRTAKVRGCSPRFGECAA